MNPFDPFAYDPRLRQGHPQGSPPKPEDEELPPDSESEPSTRTPEKK